MKLTEEKLKQLIAEELGNINPAKPNPDPSAGNEKEKVTQVNKLGDEMIATGKALKASQVKGLDATEIGMISSMLALILQIASEKSAGALLGRLQTMLSKHAGG